MPEDEYTQVDDTSDTDEEPESLELFGEEEEEQEEDTGDTDAATATAEKEESAEETPTAEPSSTAQPNSRKFKSLEDAQQAYFELQRKLGEQGTELGSLRKIANEAGKPDYLFENTDTLKWQPVFGGHEEARRGSRILTRNSSGDVFALGDDGEWRDRHGVVYYTPRQYKSLAEELKDDFTDENGEVDTIGLMMEIDSIRQQKNAERQAELAKVVLPQGSVNAAPDQTSYQEERQALKEEAKDSDAFYEPYFKQADELAMEAEKKQPGIMKTPGYYKTLLALSISSEIAEIGPVAWRKKMLESPEGKPAATTRQPRRVVVTENGSRAARADTSSEKVTLGEY